jgi:hypothetical protein
MNVILPLEPRLELLSDKHDTTKFNCGSGEINEKINDFLAYSALSAQEESYNRTYVLVGNPSTGELDAVIGFISLNASLQRIRLPNNEKTSVPVVEISALARDVSVKGMGSEARYCSKVCTVYTRCHG